MNRYWLTSTSVLLALFLLAPTLSAQTGCVPQNGTTTFTTTCGPSGQDCGENTKSTYGLTGGEPDYGWQPGAAVQVNIVTAGYSPAQLAVLYQAFQDWQGVGGVTFQISYDSTSIVSGQQNTYTVQQGSGMGSLGDDTPQATDDNGRTVSAQTTLNSTVTGLNNLLYTMTHAIGHTFGLDENDDPTSIMDDTCAIAPFNCVLSPSLKDMGAVDCEDTYSENDCINPGNSSNPACQCGSGTSGDCSGGLICGANGAAGVCGCSDSCDDPTCLGWTNECGTCRNDSDCADGGTCIGSSCLDCNVDACQNSQCPGYDDLSCNCPSNECYSTDCPNYYNDNCDGGGGQCDNDGDECDPQGCNYNEFECDYDCECGFSGSPYCNYLKLPPGGSIPDFTPAAPADVKTDTAHPMCDALPPQVPPGIDKPGVFVVAVLLPSNQSYITLRETL